MRKTEVFSADVILRIILYVWKFIKYGAAVVAARREALVKCNITFNRFPAVLSVKFRRGQPVP
jgi:hypothetical protein